MGDPEDLLTHIYNKSTSERSKIRTQRQKAFKRVLKASDGLKGKERTDILGISRVTK